MNEVMVIRKIKTIRIILQEVEDSLLIMEALKDSSRSIPVNISSQLLNLKLEIEKLNLKVNRKELKNFGLLK